MPRYAPNLIGRRFNRLVVIDRAENDKHLHSRWVCKCDCGNEVIVAARHLLSGNTQSCGCYASEQSRKRRTTHGDTNTKLFQVWINMVQRCHNPNHPKYENWGGRGISVCDEWKDDFLSFKTWAFTNGYSDGLSIDRIDNDGNYQPDNCRWATAKQQANNRRNNIVKENLL